MEIRLRHFFVFLSWWQILIISIVFAIIVILFMPFSVSAKVYANLLAISGFFAVYILKKLNIIAGKLAFENDGVYFTDKKGRSKRVYLDFPKKKKKNGGWFARALRQRKINLCFHGGVMQDEYQTAMLCGSVISLTSAAMPLIEGEYNTSLITNIIKTSENDVLTVTLEFKSKTSLFKIFVNFIRR